MPHRFRQNAHLGRILAIASACLALSASPLLRASDAGKKAFDLPADEAANSLKAFSNQSGIQVLIRSDLSHEVRTNAVHGELDPRDALNRMLAGTGLEVVEDPTSGALAVVRSAPAPNAQGAVVTTGDRPSLSPSSELGTGTISGSIVRPPGGNSVKGLTVTVVETGQTGTTDAFGRFSIIGVAPGKYTLAVTGNGYPTLNIKGVVAHAHTEEKLAGQVMPMAGLSGIAGETIVAAMSESEVVELEKYEVMDRKPFVDENMDIVRTENDVQPYYIMNSQQIEVSGATNVEDFLKQQLTMNTEYIGNGQQYSNNLGNTSAINLRGLGTNETLILIDGRRAAGVAYFGSVAQPDLNGIPLGAIDRIEILPSSASAIYGGAALGGVVNIVLKKNYQGGQISYTYDTPTNADAPLRTLDASYGFSLEGGKTHVMVAAHYADSKPLLVGQRAGLIERDYAAILENEPSYLYSQSSPFNGATTNIASADGSNLVLKSGTPLNSPITYIPAGTAPGTDLTSGLLANAGSYNLNLASDPGTYGLKNFMASAPRDKSLMATIRREMTSRLEAFVEASTESNSSVALTDYVTAYAPYSVPSTSPDNPFRQNVIVTIPSPLSFPLSADSVTQSVTTGLLAHLPGDWTSEVDYTWSRNSLGYTFNVFDNTDFSSALASGGINPFVDTIAYPPNLAPYLEPTSGTNSSTVNDLGLRASGSVWSLPWGAPTLTFGLEHRREGNANEYAYTSSSLTPANNQDVVYFGQSQSINSAYLEAKVPLVTTKNAVPLIRSLDLQLAGRSEVYTVNAGTPYAYIVPVAYQAYDPPQGVHQTIKYTSSNPTVGLKYKPADEVTFRVSYAKAFLPPTPAQLLPNLTLNPSYGGTIYDPKTGQTYSSYQVIYGGNPDLKPQTSADWDFGFIWEPMEEPLKGLRIDLEYYRITQPNYITTPSPQQVVSDPAYASRVTRDPTTGLISVIDTSYVNAEEYKTAGWDLSLDYRKPTAVGIFDLHAVGTVIEQDDRQYTTGSQFLNYVGYPSEGGEVKTKANFTLTWEYKQWTIGWTTTYFGGYRVEFSPGSPGDIQYLNGAPYTYFTAAVGSNTIPSQLYHEIFASYAFGKTSTGKSSGWTHSLLSNVTVQAGIKNLFNALPPLDVNGYTAVPYYYSPYGDPRLRDFWVRISKSF